MTEPITHFGDLGMLILDINSSCTFSLRWLDEQEQSVSYDIWRFSSGRRVRIGYKIAWQELFLTITRLASCFDYVAVIFHNLITHVGELIVYSGPAPMKRDVQGILLLMKSRFLLRLLSEARISPA